MINWVKTSLSEATCYFLHTTLPIFKIEWCDGTLLCGGLNSTNTSHLLKCYMGDGCSGTMMGILRKSWCIQYYLESDRNFAAYVSSSWLQCPPSSALVGHPCSFCSVPALRPALKSCNYSKIMFEKLAQCPVQTYMKIRSIQAV